MHLTLRLLSLSTHVFAMSQLLFAKVNAQLASKFRIRRLWPPQEGRGATALLKKVGGTWTKMWRTIVQSRERATIVFGLRFLSCGEVNLRCPAKWGMGST